MLNCQKMNKQKERKIIYKNIYNKTNRDNKDEQKKNH